MLSSWTWGESSDNRPAVPWNKSQRAQYARSAPRRSCFHDAVDTLQQLSQLTCSPCTAAAPTKDIKEIYGASMNRITWEQWPAGVHPKDGGLPSSRLLRKIEQIESMLLICMHLIDMIRPLRVVEFCGGSGYIVLPLAALYPDIEFVLIDYKAESIARASHRLKTSRMSNVRIIEGDIGEYEEVFQLGIALHACGGATDMSMIKCLKQSAGFVMCPCCIGKVLTSRSQGLSKQFAGQLSDVSPLLFPALPSSPVDRLSSSTWPKLLTVIMRAPSTWSRRRYEGDAS